MDESDEDEASEESPGDVEASVGEDDASGLTAEEASEIEALIEPRPLPGAHGGQE